MQMQEMEITIGNDGRVLVHVSGAAGQDCVSLSNALEQAVGTVEERNFTPEYYEQQVNGQMGIRVRER